jgi:neutral ceramidase
MRRHIAAERGAIVMPERLLAGSAAVDISPVDSQFLFGYPHVARYSTGVHDPLLASALYVCDGPTAVMFVGADVIFVPKALALRARQRIAAATGVPASHVMVTATHTHSGPSTVKYLSNEADAVVPEPDPRFLGRLEDGIVAAAAAAHSGARPAQLGLGVADGSAVGGNRRDPAGPSNPRMPVLAVRAAADGAPIAVMLVCSMHPTVLHEDSTLVSGDFPGLARQYLQQTVLKGCPVIWHTGPAGNQSPRHVTRGNTFAEAKRLGEALGASIADSLASIQYEDGITIGCRQAFVELPLRDFPAEQDAGKRLTQVKERLDQLRRSGADPRVVRTAECDWFGAEESLILARAAQSGRLQGVAATCMPAEIQAIRLGRWTFVGWQGEVFVDFALEVQRQRPDTFVISLANGELQGYLVTAEAVAEQGYEASNGLFLSPQSGEMLVRGTLDLLRSG